jgi:hypothetical protein
MRIIAAFFRRRQFSPEEALAANDNARPFAPSFSSDGNGRAMTIAPSGFVHPLKPPVDEFNLDDVNNKPQTPFTDLLTWCIHPAPDRLRQHKEIRENLEPTQHVLLPQALISAF